MARVTPDDAATHFSEDYLCCPFTCMAECAAPCCACCACPCLLVMTHKQLEPKFGSSCVFQHCCDRNVGSAKKPKICGKKHTRAEHPK